jgi:hypothetical protein
MGRGRGSRGASGGGGGGGGGGGAAAPTAPARTTEGGVAGVELTDAEQQAVKSYASSGYVDTNKTLRGEPKPRYREVDTAKVASDIAGLDAAMAKGRLAQETTLYRGTSMFILDNPTVGTVFQDKGFLSTGRAEAAIKQHSRDAMLRITAPKGTHAIDVKSVTGGRENEILLPRGTKLKVTGITKVGNLNYVDAKIVR